MKFRVFMACWLSLPCIVHAGGIDVKVNKDLIAVSPMQPDGSILLTAPPNTVSGLAPIQLHIFNKKTGVSVNDSANPDGSISVPFPGARPKDTLRLTFIGADGKKKEVKIKIPEGAYLSSPPHPMSIPGEVPPPMAQQSTVTDSQIIIQEGDLKNSGVIE